MTTAHHNSGLARKLRAKALCCLLVSAVAWGGCKQTAPAQSGGTDTSQAGANGNPPTASFDRYAGTAPPELREQPPEAGVTPDWTFPKITHHELENGFKLRLVERHSLPLVDLRLVVLSGQASDGNKPGLAVIAGEALKAGGTGAMSSRELLNKVESLGSSLSIRTDQDSTKIELSVTSDHFETALDLLAQVAQKPRFDAGEYGKLKTREMDRVSSLARSSATWAAQMVLSRQLYSLPSGVHPYANYDATKKEIEHVMLYDSKRWHAQHFTPKNAVLVIAGDVDEATAKTATEKAFGAWRGQAPPKLTFTAPKPPEKLLISLVDRPDSPQSEILVATLGPERQADNWATMRVANQILGGGVAARLFMDVREQRSLAYSTYSSLTARANGPVPIVLSAGTQTAKTGLAIQALLEHMAKMRDVPAQEEVEIATRYLSDIFLLGTETVGAIADLTARLAVYRLPDDYFDNYRKEVSGATPAAIAEQARRYFKENQAVIVVAGDAARLATPLSHFGEVHIIDPEDGFKTRKLVPHDPSAKLELERIDGT